MTADKAGNLFRRVVAKEMLEGKHTQQHDPQRWGYMLRTGFGSNAAPLEYTLVGLIVDTYLEVANDEHYFWKVANATDPIPADWYYSVTQDARAGYGLTFTAPKEVYDLFNDGNLTIGEVEAWQNRGVSFEEAGRRIWSTVSYGYYCTRCENLGSFADPMDAAVGFDSGTDAYCLCPIGQDAKAEQEERDEHDAAIEDIDRFLTADDLVASHLAANDPDALDDVVISEAVMDAIDADFAKKFDAALEKFHAEKEGK